MFLDHSAELNWFDIRVQYFEFDGRFDFSADLHKFFDDSHQFFFLNHPGLVLSHCYYLNTCHIGDVWTFHTLYYVDIWHIGAIWTFVTFVLFSGVLDQLSQWYSSMPSSETIDMVLIDLLLAWLVLCSLSRRFLRPSHDSKSYWFWCSGTHVIHLREFR